MFFRGLQHSFRRETRADEFMSHGHTVEESHSTQEKTSIAPPFQHPGPNFSRLQEHMGVASKLTRRGKPQVLIHVSTYQGNPFWNAGFLSRSHMCFGGFGEAQWPGKGYSKALCVIREARQPRPFFRHSFFFFFVSLAESCGL